MYDGYLAIGGVEVLNRARATAYLKALLPRVEVLCDSAGLEEALGHSPYELPSTDGAPWYRGQRVAAGRFLGLFPGKVNGAEDSTREVTVTELSGNGAILTSPRYGSKELRFVATAFALDEDAMNEGMSWLRDVLSNDGCSDSDLGCTGRDIRMFSAFPVDIVSAYNYSRSFHRVEATEGPLVTKKFAVRDAFVMWQVEFTLTAGIPWAFSSLASVGAVDMDTATNFQDPAGENCGAALNAYDEFVADPYFTAISRPPRPPVILPPNILDINSWRRKTLAIPSPHTQRWGRTVPVVHVNTEGAEAQYLRLRFYKDGAWGCDYDGEFLVSYIPPWSTLKLDAIKREATMYTGGRWVPAGHLLFGSDGTPFLWPTLGCQYNYTLTADLMPGQSGVAVVLDVAVRE
jgi:hypothetical protein